MKTRILGEPGYWYAERLGEYDNKWERIVEPCTSRLEVKWQLLNMEWEEREENQHEVRNITERNDCSHEK